MWKESKVALLLGKVVEGVSDTVMEEVGDCNMYCIGKWWDLLHEELMDRFWSTPLPFYEQLDTAHALILSIFLTD